MHRNILYSNVLTGVLAFLLISSIFILVYAHQIPPLVVQEQVLYVYTNKGVFDYVVSLYPNIVYDTDVLVNPDKVFLKLADRVIVNLTYTFSSQPPASDTSTILDVVITLHHPQVWSKRIDSTTIRSQGGVVKYTVELSIPELLSLARNISQQLDLSSTKYSVIITCNAKTTALILNTTKTAEFPLSFQIDLDLARKVVEFTQREFSSTSVQKNTVTAETVVNVGSLSIGVSRFRWISTLLLATTATPMAIVIGLRILQLYRGKRKGSAQRILEKYKSVITDASEVSSEHAARVIKVKSFKELLKVSENTVKPIVHLETSNKHLFYVFDEDTLYLYEHEEN